MLLVLLLLLQITPTTYAGAPTNALVSIKSLDTNEARVLVQSLNCNNADSTLVVIHSLEYLTIQETLSKKLSEELSKILKTAGLSDVSQLYLPENVEYLQEYANRYTQLMVEYQMQLELYIIFSEQLPIDAQMQILHPNFNNFVRNELYDANGSMIPAKAEIFADMIADAINAAFIAAGRPDLALLEATITSDMNFSIYMSDGTPFSVIGCTQVLNTSICHGFLHLFCGFSSLSFTPTDPTLPPTPDDHDDGHCIDYSQPDLVAPGSKDGFSINLTKETLTLPDGYEPSVYSIDGGERWKPVKGNLSAEKFPKLFNKDITLQISDKPIEKETKKPPKDAQIVKFPLINKRPKPPSSW